MKPPPRIWLRFDLDAKGWHKGHARFNPGMPIKYHKAFCRAEEQFIKALNKAKVNFQGRAPR